jgi:hypothetical protein
MRDPDEPSPAKALNLRATSPEQLLELYADVTRQTKGSVARNVSAMRVDFRSRGALTRRETIFALEMIGALHGLAFVKNAEGAIEILPLAEARKHGNAGQ